MVNSNKMRWIKTSLVYTLLFGYLYSLYKTMLPAILLHYPIIDFRYFIFIAIQIFWCTYFYQIVYQYIILYTFIRIRLNRIDCLKLLFKQFLKYIVFFIFLHFILFFYFFRQIPFGVLCINIAIQCFGFIFVLFLKKVWNYSYILIVFIILCCHFIV